jgi:GT2 family glycosyltransferase
VRKSALEGAPLFDPTLFMYYEDLELALRLRAQGHRLLYEPAAVVSHQRAGSVKRAWQRPGPIHLHYANRNRLRIVARHFPLALLLRKAPGIAATLVWFDWLLLLEAGPLALLRAIAAQLRFTVAGLRERRAVAGEAARWLPWMTRHRLRDLPRLRARIGRYVQ